MVKTKKEQKLSKYSTIIASKENIKRLADARNLWKEQEKNYSQIGLMPFIMYLLDSYEQQRK